MATDRNGHTIAAGEVYALCGKVRRIDGDTVLVALGERGEQVVRVDAADVVLIDSTGGGVTDHGALTGLPDNDHPQYVLKSAGTFDTVAPSSSVTPTFLSTDLARMTEVDAYASYIYGLLDAAKQPLDADLTAIAALSTTTFGRSLLAMADAAAVRTALSLGALALLASVGTSQITDANVTLAKLANLAAATIIGRASGAGTGVPTALSASQVTTIVASTGTFADAGHTHGAADIEVEDGWFGGAFAGLGFTNLKEVLLHLDATLTP